MIPPELRKQVIDVVIECKHKAFLKLNYQVGPIEIRFDLIGLRAATANTHQLIDRKIVQSNLIRINEEYLLKHTEDMLNQTIPHEVAHIVTNLFYNRRCSHGWRWRKIMREVYHLVPDRCHSYEAASNRRKTRSYTLICLCCGFIHRFKQHHYNVIMNTGGLRHRECRKCKKSLEGCEIVLDK